MSGFKSFLIASVLLAVSSPSLAKTVRYELTIKNEPVNLSAKKTVNFALTVNGGIPAPTLEFTEGDDAEILIKNGLQDEEVSIHWHGILLPADQDGVPYVNTPPIYAGASYLFKFKIRQNGTFWYHSHTMLQEQKGVFGAIVIHPKKKAIRYDRDAVVVLNDWSDEDADQILRNLRKDGDYYQFKKDSVRSYFGALSEGARAFKTHLDNEWIRMGGMDLSDVGYDAFLINGKRDSSLAGAKPGEKIRLRIVNAAASSYFHVAMGVPMQVISADGVDIKPVRANEILIGMAETYDVLLTVPEQKSYELRATAQDGTGHASFWIGSGEKVLAPEKPKPDLYAGMEHDHSSMAGMDHSQMAGMDHSQMAGMDHSQMAGMDHSEMTESADAVDWSSQSDAMLKQNQTPRSASHEAPIPTLTVDALTALQPTTLPKSAPVHDIKLVLGGDMNRYIWHLNGKAISQDRLLMIKKGEVVRFTFVNETMMHHPMHLHGHFFRVVNEAGERSPLKHTVDVPPHMTRTVEFFANEPGQWMLHCHNLYHMDSGMARVVRYEGFNLDEAMQTHDKHDPHTHDHLYTYGSIEAASNHAEARFKLMNTWDEVELSIESANTDGMNFSFENPWETEGDLFYRRWSSNFFNLTAGADFYDDKFYGEVGLGYTLPMLIETRALVNYEGRFRFDVEKRFQWTRSIYTDADFTWRPGWSGDRDSEFEITLMYQPVWTWAAGLMFTEKSAGVGAQFQF